MEVFKATYTFVNTTMFQSVVGNTLMDIVKYQTENTTSSYDPNAPAELQKLLIKDLL